MTLALTLACNDGVVMAADSEVSSGPFRQVGNKIFQFSNSIVWSASGVLGLIQAMKQQIEALPPENHLSPLSALANVFQENAARIVSAAKDRHRRALGRPEAEPTIDLLFSSWTGQEAQILHIGENGIGEWLQSFGWGATGLGQMFAYPLLRTHEIRGMNIDRGCILAYRVIEDAIECGAYGLGPPVKLSCCHTVTENSVSRVQYMSVEGNRLEAIRDAVLAWRQLEREAFHQSFGSRSHNL